MANDRKYTAHINRKGLDATGVTEDHTRAMASRLGASTMLIVEAKHLNVTTDAEGKVSLALALTSVEPVPAEHDETVRRFQRGLYLLRPEQEGQAVISGTAGANEAEVKSAVDGLAAAVETDDGGNVVGIWDGRTDGPLTRSDPCDYPTCVLPSGHDGDHDDPGV